MTDHNKTDTTIIFNRDTALMRLGDSEELLYEVAQVFFEQGPKLLNELRLAIASEDFDEMETSAHTLKGSASVLAGNEVVGLAQQAEAHARQNNLARIVDDFDELERAVSLFITALRASVMVSEQVAESGVPVSAC